MTILRELRKIVALVLIFTMIIPMVSYAAEMDIDVMDTEEHAQQSIDVSTSEIASQPAEENTESQEENLSATEGTTEPEETTPVEEETTEPEETTSPTEERTEPEETTAPTEQVEEETEAPTDETTAPTEETVEVEEEISEDADAEELTSDVFSCHTFDDRGNLIEGYWSEEDDTWYLFLTSTQAVGNVEIHYTGVVTEASQGEVDTEEAIVRGAFTASGDKVILKGIDETEYAVSVLQSSLPSVYITLNGITLDTVNSGSKSTKYPGNTVAIMDPSGAFDLTAENSVEFKGRGNSTWMYFDKKGYQIKFDSKTSVLGMGKAKKWVLLANAADETLLHNMLALDLTSQMDMGFVPEFRFVDLWVNGEYRGNYIIGEKVEIGSSRLNLQHSDGTLFEQDQGFYYEEDYYFSSSPLRKYFVVKDTNADDKDTAKMNEIMDVFRKKLDELAVYLYSTPSKDVTLEKLESYIDVDSIAKYYLINEYTCNTESTAGSFYWYQDGPDDVLHVGPIWDFDSSMGNEKINAEYYMTKHILFECLLATPVFYNRTVEIYNQYKSAFDGMASKASEMKAQIEDSVAMNSVKWNVWGQANPKETLNDYSASYEEGFSKLVGWLNNRASTFQVQSKDTAWTRVDDTCSTLDVFYETDTEPSRVEFAVWSDQNGQDDIKYYRAMKGDDGIWHASADLSAHQTTAKYTVHVYTTVEGNRSRVAAGYAYVEKVNQPAVKAVLSEDSREIGITARYVGSYTNIRAEVWCNTSGQDTLKSYALEKQDDYTYTADVSLADHKQAGTYEICLYGTKGGKSVLLAQTSVDATKGIWPVASVEVVDGIMTLNLKNGEAYSSVWYLVWGEENGDSDKKWYEAVLESDGNWIYSLDLAEHGESGVYQIRVYVDGKQTLLDSLETTVDTILIPVYRLYNPNTLEHLLTTDGSEKNQLLSVGWQLDGLAWSAPSIGSAVYRLYNPYDDWHTYSSSDEEISTLTEAGWKVDGVVCHSADESGIPVYRLFNPYEQKNYHLLTMSETELEQLLALGWKLDGKALYAAVE